MKSKYLWLLLALCSGMAFTPGAFSETLSIGKNDAAVLEKKEMAKEQSLESELLDEALEKRIIQASIDLSLKESPFLYAQLSKCATIKMLKMTAVLGANEDGTLPSRSMAEVVNGKVVPAAPYWRDPEIHHDPLKENYIVDTIRTANRQLIKSGACFVIDLNSLKYVQAKNNALNRRNCNDPVERHEETLDYFEQQARRWDFLQNLQLKTTNYTKPVNTLSLKRVEPDNPYRNRILVVYRWGSGKDPVGQGCAGRSSYILMPGQYKDSRVIDGEVFYGNDHLTHEFGHYMSLSHPFPWLANTIVSYAKKRNKDLYPLSEEYLPFMQGQSLAGMEQNIDAALEKIAVWGWSLEQDTGVDPALGIPNTFGITDTPVDLGLGLPLIHGDKACTGDYVYNLTRYKRGDVMPTYDVDGHFKEWVVVPGVVPEEYVATVEVNDDVRGNIMSYWGCDCLGQTFSPDQVDRMDYYLGHKRDNIVGRTLFPLMYEPKFDYAKRVYNEIFSPIIPPTPWQIKRSFERALMDNYGDGLSPMDGAKDFMDHIEADQAFQDSISKATR